MVVNAQLVRLWVRLRAAFAQLIARFLKVSGLYRQSIYRRPRMQLVQRKAGQWDTFRGSNHPLAKPAWVHEQFFQIAQALPNAGCRTLASNFNQIHQTTGISVSKTWAYERLKRQRRALALARQRSSATARSGAIGAVGRV
jgi:hypothetical protein